MKVAALITMAAEVFYRDLKSEILGNAVYF